MKFELNIGLSIKGRRNSLADCTTRARAALAIIRSAGLQYLAERASSEYEGPSGICAEEVLVVEVNAPVFGGERKVLALAYEIAVAIEQDCVAILDPSSARGHLVGPRAAEWGSFNPEFFINYADVSLRAAA